MKQQSIRKKRNGFLVFCIAISVICPAGIPLIPIGFIKGGPVFLSAAIAGIILAVFGFYGIPLFWVGFGQVNRRMRIYDAVTLDGLLSVGEIAAQTGASQKQVCEDIRWMMAKRDLRGYFFDGETLRETRKKHHAGGFEIKTPCPLCGGAEILKKEDGYTCAFCGARRYIEE